MTAIAIPTSHSTYGRVVCRIIRRVGDGDDTGTEPAALPMSGTITFTPLTKWDRTTDYSALASNEAITGLLNPLTGELMSPGHPPTIGVDLLVGVYSVSFTLDHGAFASFPVEVLASHTAVAPLDLAHEVPYSPPPGVQHTMLVPSGLADGLLTLSGGALTTTDPGSLGGGGGGIDTETVQDIVGSMVTGAGGTYDDAAGTITLPSGGGGGGYPVLQVEVTEDIPDYTLPVGAPTDQVIGVVFTQDATGGHAVTYNGLPVTVDTTANATTLVEVWPDGSVVYPGRPGLFLIDNGDGTVDITDEFPGWVLPDVAPPNAGTLTPSVITTNRITLTVTGATDDRALNAAPYAFTTGGDVWTAYQAEPAYVAEGLTPGTAYTCNWRVRDAAGNVTTGTPQVVTTAAESVDMPFADDFNRPDSESLGADWTSPITPATVNGWSIVSGQARAAQEAKLASPILSASSPDMYVQATFTSTASSTGVMVRYPGGTENGYIFRSNGSNVAILADVNGASFLPVGEPFVVQLTPPYTLRLEAQGSTLRGYVNGNLRVTVTDTTHTTGTRAGIRAAGTGAINVQDFEMGDL